MIDVNSINEKIAVFNRAKGAIHALAWIDEVQALRAVKDTQVEIIRAAVNLGLATNDGKAANYYLKACVDIRLDSILEEMRSMAQLDIDNAEKVLK
jgi:hypothetical protein